MLYIFFNTTVGNDLVNKSIIIISKLLDINITTLLELMFLKEFKWNVFCFVTFDIAYSNLCNTNNIIFQ